MAECGPITFPCRYPIKVMGVLHAGFTDEVIATVQTHAPEVSHAATRLRVSRQGRYGSLTVSITATGEDQLRRLHTDLMALASVKLVL